MGKLREKLEKMGPLQMPSKEEIMARRKERCKFTEGSCYIKDTFSKEPTEFECIACSIIRRFRG